MTLPPLFRPAQVRTAFAAAFLATLAVFALPLAKKALHAPVRGLAEQFPLKRWFVELNGGAHRLAGRRWCNAVYRAPDGMLLSEYRGGRVDPVGIARNVSAFSGRLAARGIPYLYVLAPMKIDLGGTMLPDCLVQRANAKADAFLGELARGGVQAIDLRAAFSATPEEVARRFYRTDHHWNNDAVFEAFGILAPEFVRTAGADPGRVVPFASRTAWRRDVWPQCFMGTKARRTGRLFGGLDDMVVYTPRFQTDMTLDIPAAAVRLAGDFGKTVMYRAGAVRAGGPWGFRTDAYSLVYAGVGGSYGVARHGNPGAPVQKRLLLVGDSFARPLEGLLAVVFGDVLALDQRRFAPGETVAGFVEDFKPDLVVQLNNPSAFGADMLSGPKKRRPVLFDYGELR